MMAERGLAADHTTICRWVHRYAPILADHVRTHIHLTNDSWRVDETYIKVRGTWMYLYGTVKLTNRPKNPHHFRLNFP
jgi:transposase-like protein